MFEVGKKVIAIFTHPSGDYKKGQVFELLGIKKGCSHAPVLVDIGLTLTDSTLRCPICSLVVSSFGQTQWCNGKSFAPYDDSLSELTAEDILEETDTHALN